MVGGLLYYVSWICLCKVIGCFVSVVDCMVRVKWVLLGWMLGRLIICFIVIRFLFFSDVGSFVCIVQLFCSMVQFMFSVIYLIGWQWCCFFLMIVVVKQMSVVVISQLLVGSVGQYCIISMLSSSVMLLGIILY